MKILTLDEACTFMRTLLESKYVFACIGTYIRSDDASALELCNNLIHEYPNNIVLCEHGLENCIGSIVELDARKIAIIDSVLIGDVSAGSIILFNEDEINETCVLSTHSIPITTSISILHNTLGPDINVVFLGIVVKNIDIGLDMSPEVENTVRNVIRCLKGR
ncbi:hydrogenase maturation protease [Ignisphaera aggregans DSM 17230]|uniref:Hydrogenase maturation protease n=1 Tax=Ignisphaera aggregans (strain DSM 17230 / JCM 13409 / AQ1.S1) TaxID=583356 RepID=E0ST33_IGNAA|nr:hydrogenase maturation protease [Ignisphaera aggregans DSM 17230]